MERISEGGGNDIGRTGRGREVERYAEGGLSSSCPNSFAVPDRGFNVPCELCATIACGGANLVAR